ncbi:hypothetical protein ACXGXA_24590, partial [Salmonella enterica subsp. enterica serovar Infantis]
GACKQRDSEGKPTMKPHWEISQQEADACLAATEWPESKKKMYNYQRRSKVLMADLG